MTLSRLSLQCLTTIGLVLTAAVHAEAIYRCGNSYSQTPCTDAKVLQIDDSRDANRKKEADATTRRDILLAKELERNRVQQELASAPKKSRRPQLKKGSIAPIKTQKDRVVLIKPERIKPVLHKHRDFTALVPGTKKKSDTPKKAVNATRPASR